MSNRHYDEQQIAAILRRAAQLQQRGGPSEERLSLVELEQIAREAGIDPSYVRQAATELALTGEPVSENPWVGGPLTLHFEQTVAGVLVGDDFDHLLQEIRGNLGDVGRTDKRRRSEGWRFELRLLDWANVALGRAPQPTDHALTWRSSAGSREISVRVWSRGGETIVCVEERLSQLAAGLYGGLVGGLGGVLAAFAFALGLPLFDSLSLAAAFAVLVLAGSWLAARSVFRSLVTARRRQLAQLTSRLVDQVRQLLGIA